MFSIFLLSLVIFISSCPINADPVSTLMEMIKKEYEKKEENRQSYCDVIAFAYGQHMEKMRDFKRIREYCEEENHKTSSSCQFLMKWPSSLGNMIDNIRMVLTQAMNNFKEGFLTARDIATNILHQSKHYEAYMGHVTMPDQVGRARDVCQHWNIVAVICYSDLSRETYQVKQACKILFN